MPRYLVVYTTYVVAGHALKNHSGPCRNPHGHNYVVRVWVERVDHSLDNLNMVIDYYMLKRSVDSVLSELDHANLNEVLGVDNPTSELLASWLAKRVAEKLGGEYRVARVEVCETPDFCAIYEP
ncbi:6-pyruvoyl tetrahydropterin synthase and hypothetical protein [Pyrolobus fumarii 1A]|uniref:6-carboxy-5,6,7,8-tetrahydropterin synthase n=1 Tax=Pyrolobus fumarii (strain DSM 11204 / 1A) TaxID=694429 RepID=G0EDQ8_PYRF1|nr:6-carboxytetrahydropterin synthase [Pyrolobus fumarii]AEM38677.1 6-pyruvoyl tetrahydropterin synthase and hypothetical protein [Pyrolobus fumarii 1A]